MSSCEEESIGRQIYICGQTMRSYADQRLKKYDLTLEQLFVLKQLSANDGQIQSQLCEGVGKSPANVTRILDRLQKKGTVCRKNNPDDRRSTIVLLTEAGERMLEDVRSSFEVYRSEVVAGISPEKQKIAIDVLKKIQENVSALS